MLGKGFTFSLTCGIYKNLYIRGYTYIWREIERERKRKQRRQKESCLRAGMGQATDGVGMGGQYEGGRINDTYV